MKTDKRAGQAQSLIRGKGLPRLYLNILCLFHFGRVRVSTQGFPELKTTEMGFKGQQKEFSGNSSGKMILSLLWRGTGKKLGLDIHSLHLTSKEKYLLMS